MDEKNLNQNSPKAEKKATGADFDKKLDQKMDKLMKKGFSEKIINNKTVSKILGSKIINDLDNYLKPYLKKIISVMGRVAILTGIFGILSGLSTLMVSIRFGFGGRFFLTVLIALIFYLVAIITGYGFIKYKKWAVLGIVATFLLSCLSFLSSLISASGIGGSFISILISFLLTAVIIKNRDIFKN